MEDFDTLFDVYRPGVVIDADKNVIGNGYTFGTSRVAGAVQQSREVRDLAIATGLEADKVAIGYADIAAAASIDAGYVLHDLTTRLKWIVHEKPSVRSEIPDLAHVRILLQLMLEEAPGLPRIYTETTTVKSGAQISQLDA